MIILTWLDPRVSDPRQLSELLKAPPEGFLDCYVVSRKSIQCSLIQSSLMSQSLPRWVDLDYGVLLRFMGATFRKAEPRANRCRIATRWIVLSRGKDLVET